MPSINRSKYWFVRVDGNHEYLRERFSAINWIDMTKMLVFLHEGETKENPHAHFVIELTSDLQKQSFDKRIKQHFNITKKSEYSSKEWDQKIEAIAYMYHENTLPLINKGYPLEILNKAKEHNEITQKVIAVNKEKAGNKLLDKLMVKVDENSTLENIIETVYDMIHDGEIYHPGDFKLKSVIQDVYIKTRNKKDWALIKSVAVSAMASDLRKYI